MSCASRRAAGLAALGLALLAAATFAPPALAASDGVVRAVLFVSPTCPHCRKVREEVLPPLWERFEGRLQVGIVSTATPTGRDLYWSAFRHYGVQQRGVPLLVVGDFALVGSEEIPRRFPDVISGYLASGGVDWPAIPGLDVLLAARVAQPTPTAEPVPAAAPTPMAAPMAAPMPTPAPTLPPMTRPAPADPVRVAAPPASEVPRPHPRSVPKATRAAPRVETTPPDGHRAGGAGQPHPPPVASAAPPEASPSPTPAPLAIPAAPAIAVTAGAHEETQGVVARVLADPRGNGLAIVVLAGMIVALLRSIAMLRRPARAARTHSRDWLTPLLGLAGVFVASYLAHVEVRGVEAVCGPVGDCNTVQQSEWARLFGVVPIGVLGVLGFAAILVTWAVMRWGTGRTSSWAAAALLAMTGLGTLFSIYLTFLEPFVIGATCLWCLSSAVIITALHGLAHGPGRAAVAELGTGR